MKKKRNKPFTGQDRRRIEESQLAEAVTVAWTLATGATMLAMSIGLIGRVYLWRVGPNDRIALIASTLYWIALVGGVAVIALTFPLTRLRRRRAPGTLVVLAVAIGAAPWIALLLQMLRY